MNEFQLPPFKVGNCKQTAFCKPFWRFLNEERILNFNTHNHSTRGIWVCVFSLHITATRKAVKTELNFLSEFIFQMDTLNPRGNNEHFSFSYYHTFTNSVTHEHCLAALIGLAIFSMINLNLLLFLSKVCFLNSFSFLFFFYISSRHKPKPISIQCV